MSEERLFQMLDEINTKIDKMATKEEVQKTVDSCFDKFVHRLDVVDTKTQSNEARIKKLEDSLQRCEEETMSALEWANNIEQNSRKSSFRIYDLPPDVDGRESMSECRDLVAIMITNELGIQISADDIAVAHRLPKPRNRKGHKVSDAHPMFVRALRMEDAVEIVICAKKKINKAKGKPTIKWDITTKNLKLMSDIFSHPNYEFATYYNGKIYGMTDDNYRVGPIGICKDLTEIYDNRVEAGKFVEPKEDENESTNEDVTPAAATAASNKSKAPKGRGQPSINQSRGGTRPNKGRGTGSVVGSQRYTGTRSSTSGF